jgi:hypothetical protein
MVPTTRRWTELVKGPVTLSRIYRKRWQKERDSTFLEVEGSNYFADALHQCSSPEETEGHVATEFGGGQQIGEAGPAQYGRRISTPPTKSPAEGDLLGDFDPSLPAHQGQGPGHEVVGDI